ncbi:NADP-dependent oxidoreductase [Fredinandcohnia humi]
MMKAAAINKYGTIDEIEIQEIPIPELRANDLLIEVHATSINPVDIAIRKGWLAGRFPNTFPLVLGWDVSGIVIATGHLVTNFKVGDEVYSYSDLSRNGATAEYIAVDENLVARKPKNLSFQEAASVPLVGICSWRALINLGNIQRGQRVLILGGSGGVGSFAIQLAKFMGAYVVCTTSTKNVPFVKRLGSDEVVDYTITGMENLNLQYDLVFDTVGREALDKTYHLVKANGKIVTISSFIDDEVLKIARDNHFYVISLTSEPSGEILSEITNLLENMAIKPQVEKVIALDEIQMGHELIESKHSRGKIVLQVKEDSNVRLQKE